MEKRISFYCPITQEVMKNPVVDYEGNTYEREAIEAWLATHTTSPITRSPLAVDQLAPNRALKDAIEDEIRLSKESGDTEWIQQKKSGPNIVAAVAPASEAPAPAISAEEQAANAKAEEVTLKVTSTKVNAEEVLVHASIVPGPGVTRSPADVCCVVDISGSMGGEASIKTDSGKEEKHGLSLLDIVKHAVKTVVQSLEANDRFSLVVFSTTARIVLELTAITEASKKKIFTEIDKLEPEDTTNLWDGLHKGLEILKTSVAGRISALLMLTDGLPNVTPPRGELAMLKKYKDEHKQLNTTINTFGFGYSIDTPLLLNLAVEGHGMHSFIPDASFVGTAFVNSISNLLVTMGTNATLSIEPPAGATIRQVLGGYSHQLTSWGAQVSVCSLQYGQSKDVLVRMSVPPTEGANLATVTLRYEVAKTAKVEELVAECSSADDGGVDLEVQRLRLDVVSAITYMIELALGGKDKEVQAALSDITELVKKCADPRAKALLQDVTGQIKEAVQKAPTNYFQKWGRHYLPSLARAHLLQQCNNFKDPGVQVYGGQLFQKKRDEVDDIFLKLPPPKPSVRRSSYISSSRASSRASSQASSQASSAPRSMRAYHNAAGPCFAGECLVLMADGTERRVDQIKKGDVVQSANGTAGVTCVVKTYCMKAGVDGVEDLVVLPGGLKLTPFHPIRVGGVWRFPVDLYECQQDMPCAAVYNFVLQQGHMMIIQGVECITLGHGIQGDKVVSHPYFGTSRVVEDLQEMPGWQHGLVELHPGSCPEGKCMVRDKDTGLVCGFARIVERDV